MGGISALVIGIVYLITIALYALLEPCTALFRSFTSGCLPGNWIIAWTIVGLSVLTDFLFLPVALSLYLALKGVNRNIMLIATGFVGLFIVLDLGVTWPSISSLITLSGNYAAATNDTQRAAYVAAANYASAVLTFSGPVYSILVLSFGILMIGLVMLKGIFGKSTAYLGLVTGILGIISVAGSFLLTTLGATIIITSVLTTIWAFFVGYRLYKLGQP